MTSRLAILALALAALPGGSRADRGALTLEVGPALTVLDASPSQGSGSGTLGTASGAAFGMRRALSNDFELAATGLWEASVEYFHSGVDFTTGTATVHGTLAETVRRYGGTVGVRIVRGYVWRLHLGLDVGWIRTTYTHRDLLDVSVPGNEHSFGLALRDRVSDRLVLAPVAGAEWQVTDHWAVTLMPRLELLSGGASRVGLFLPMTIGYSWFIF
jgi:opacity protein-like surface antigen